MEHIPWRISSYPVNHKRLYNGNEARKNSAHNNSSGWIVVVWEGPLRPLGQDNRCTTLSLRYCREIKRVGELRAKFLVPDSVEDTRGLRRGDKGKFGARQHHIFDGSHKPRIGEYDTMDRRKHDQIASGVEWLWLVLILSPMPLYAIKNEVRYCSCVEFHPQWDPPRPPWLCHLSLPERWSTTCPRWGSRFHVAAKWCRK